MFLKKKKTCHRDDAERPVLELHLCREHPLYVLSLYVGGNIFLLCHLILADTQLQYEHICSPTIWHK